MGLGVSGRDHEEREIEGARRRGRRRGQEVSISHSGPAAHARVKYLLRTPDSWSRNNPENFKHQVLGVHSWGSSQTRLEI